MQSLRRILNTWRNVFRKEAVDGELDAEVNGFLDLLTDEKIKAGIAPAEARRLAHIELGGAEQVKQQTREARTGFLLDTVLGDLRFGVRVLARNPGFTLVAIITLALGIGATTALFSVVDAVLLRPLPYPHAGQLTWIAEVNNDGYPSRVSYPNFADWRKDNHSFASMAAYTGGDVSISGGSEPRRVQASLVTRGFFKLFGVQPSIGRDFLPEEHKPSTAPAAIIGQALWRGDFGSNPKVIGKTVRLDGVPLTVVGVMPPSFTFPDHTQLWTTAEAFGAERQGRTSLNDRVIGLLKPNVSFEQARADISAITRRLKKRYPSAYQAKDAQVISLISYLVGPVKPALLTLLTAVGLVLLIVCVNIANLLLALDTKREKEFAVRGALGASWGRLARQLFIECFLLSAMGGTLGLGLAYWAIQILKIVAPSNIPRIETVSLNGSALCFTITISLLCCLLFGCLPAWNAIKINIQEALKSGSGQHTSGHRTRRAGRLLITSEIALAFMLLIGAGLLVRSFERLQHQDLGFHADHVLTASLSFPILSLDPHFTPPSLVPTYHQILDRVSAIHGVQSAAFASHLPFDGPDSDGHFFVEGQADLPGLDSDAGYRVVSANYFHVLQVKLLKGRFFSGADTISSPGVVIINTSLAKRLWPHGSALGHHLWFDSFDPEKKWLTVVGVVDNVREEGPSVAANAIGYVCYTQHPNMLMETALIVRSEGNPSNLSATVRKQIQSVSKDVPIRLQTMDSIVAAATAHQRFQVELLGFFAWLAMLLAGIGIFGVLSYSVDRIRPEIGIRIALGADSWTILRSVLKQGLGAAVIGAVIGLAGAFAIARTLSSMLYQISPADPITYCAATAALFALVLLASFLPAYRASKTPPAIALKSE